MHMNDPFPYDVFLSHSRRTRRSCAPLAERLRADGLRVWFDEWVLKPGDSIPAKIEEGLEHSRVLVLCMSAHAFGSDWAQLEAGTFRFRDPLNKERRFIPLRLDDAPIKGSLAQFLYINWRPADREQEYAKLLEACRPPAKPAVVEAEAAGEQVAEKAIQLDYKDASIICLCVQSGWKARPYRRGRQDRAAVGRGDGALPARVQRPHRHWSGERGMERRSTPRPFRLSATTPCGFGTWRRGSACVCSKATRDAYVYSVALSADQRRALSGS